MERGQAALAIVEPELQFRRGPFQVSRRDFSPGEQAPRNVPSQPPGNIADCARWKRQTAKLGRNHAGSVVAPLNAVL
jgi:hypothetical protein